MKAGDVQARMIELENHDQSWTAAEFLEWLLDLDDDGEEALVAEARRAFILAETHYQRVSKRVAVLNPQMISQVAFLQGATFAAAALGRKPYGEEPLHDS